MSNFPRREKAKSDLERLKNAAAADDPAELLVDIQNGELFLHGPIGTDGITAKAVVTALKDFGSSPVRVYINSIGGSVSEGVSVYNAFKRHSGEITMVVDGIAASIATVILCASDTRLIDASSACMIHRPWSIAIGDEDFMQREADLLQRFGGMISRIYSHATGKSVSEIEAAMASETWLFGREAVDWKICTGMTGSDPGYRPKLASAKRAALRSKMASLMEEPDYTIAASLR